MTRTAVVCRHTGSVLRGSPERVRKQVKRILSREPLSPRDPEQSDLAAYLRARWFTDGTFQATAKHPAVCLPSGQAAFSSSGPKAHPETSQPTH